MTSDKSNFEQPFNYSEQRDNLEGYMNPKRPDLTGITPINSKEETKNMNNQAFTQEALRIQEETGEYVFVLPVNFTDKESEDNLKFWTMEVGSEKGIVIQELHNETDDCSDGRPAAATNTLELDLKLTEPVRSFGGMAGMFGTLFEELLAQNNLSKGDAKMEEFIDTFSSITGNTLHSLDLNFNVHTDDHQSGDSEYYAGCAHVAGLAGRVEEYKEVLEQIDQENNVLIDQNIRTGAHLEHGLILTNGSYTLNRDGKNQFFTIDGKVKDLIYTVISAWNTGIKEFDTDFDLKLSRKNVLIRFVGDMVRTAEKLVISSGKPITLIDTTKVEREYASDEPSALGNVSARNIRSDKETLEQELLKLLS